MKTIGLMGPMGSGKSVVARILAGLGYQRIRFSNPLKNMLRSLGLTTEHIEGSLKEEPCDLLSGSTPRYCMQTLGANWAREMIDPDFWLNLWLFEIKKLEMDHKFSKVVSEDCRFPNEAEAIKSMGGEIWEIKRHNYEYEGHSTELAMMDITPDKIILNHGTIQSLTQAINKLMKDDITTDNNDVSRDVLNSFYYQSRPRDRKSKNSPWERLIIKKKERPSDESA